MTFASFFDPVALAIVLGGTLLAVLLRSPLRDTGRAVAALGTLWRRRFDATPMIAQIGALGRIARRHGTFTLDRSKIADPDLAAAIAGIVDGADAAATATSVAHTCGARGSNATPPPLTSGRGRRRRHPRIGHGRDTGRPGADVRDDDRSRRDRRRDGGRACWPPCTARCSVIWSRCRSPIACVSPAAPKRSSARGSRRRWPRSRRANRPASRWPASHDRRIPPPRSPSRPLWLVTLADLALLLMGFLVLVNASHRIDRHALARGFRQGFGTPDTALSPPPAPMPVAAAASPDFATGTATLSTAPVALDRLGARRDARSAGVADRHRIGRRQRRGYRPRDRQRHHPGRGPRPRRRHGA